jgi:hypothetical protein
MGIFVSNFRYSAADKLLIEYRNLPYVRIEETHKQIIRKDLDFKRKMRQREEDKKI